MLARLQQIITLSLLGIAGAWAVWHVQAGRPVSAVLGALGILFFHALVLALELALLHRTHGDDPTPRAGLRLLLRAWWDETRSAVRVFAWQQPFRSQRWPDQLPAAPAQPPRRGVLLVHGFVCNRGFWNRWMSRLTVQGVPFIALDLEPVFGSIDAYIAQIDAAAQRLLQATGTPPVVVAHSMGGLAVRRWLAEAVRADGLAVHSPAAEPDARPALARVHHVITLGSPHHGTWLARLAFTRNTRQMQLLSGWLQTLAQREASGLARHFTCFYSHCDNIVFPPRAATLAGALNVHLPGVAHVHMAESPEPWATLQARLADPLTAAAQQSVPDVPASHPAPGPDAVVLSPR
jgi:triacylglycerol esterase/lipase EstA (alpha/beta hydrolase family)